MDNFDEKNHEEQSSKIPTRLLDMPCTDSRHSSTGSVFVNLKTYNNEKEHGKGRPNYQSDNRCNHCNTLFYKRYFRNFWNRAFGPCRNICADKLNQLLSTLRTFWTENMPNEKSRKSHQLTIYKNNGGIKLIVLNK